MSQKNESKEVQTTEKELSEILKIKREKLDDLKNRGKDPFQQVKFDKTHDSVQILEGFEQLEGQNVRIAGRIMSKRVMGKASFFHIQDGKGKIQVYARKDVMGDEPYMEYKQYDIGDIVGVEGHVFKTNAGEISVKSTSVVLLAKALQPLPEKFHGLKDMELRYRQRYVDLIVNAEVKETFEKRSKIIRYIREYLDNQGFMEVETPILHTTAGGAAARPFITHHNTLDIDMYMRIATELHLKRLIVGGFERVYEMGRIFRNEGMDIKHNPEFTTIEIYQAYTDYKGMMDLCENLFVYCTKKLYDGNTKITYQGQEIDMSTPWTRLTMADAVKQYTGVEITDETTDEQAVQQAKKLSLEVSGNETKGTILNMMFEEFVEDKLVQPTFICDYPVEVSPLSKRKADQPWLTERFELFITGRELANAFSELNDPIDQKERFEAQARQRAQGDEEAHMMDEDFVLALEYGMPPTGGIGIGIDRMVMLLTDQYSIRDVLLFPTMKPIGQEKSGSQKAKAVRKPDFSKVTIEPMFEDMVDFETFSKSDFRVVKVKDCKAVPKSNKLLCFTLDDGSGTDRTILSGIHPYYEPEELVGKTLVAITNLPPRKMMGIDSCGMLLSAIHSEEGEERLNLLMVDDFIPAGAKLY